VFYAPQVWIVNSMRSAWIVVLSYRCVSGGPGGLGGVRSWMHDSLQHVSVVNTSVTQSLRTLQTLHEHRRRWRMRCWVSWWPTLAVRRTTISHTPPRPSVNCVIDVTKRFFIFLSGYLTFFFYFARVFLFCFYFLSNTCRPARQSTVSRLYLGLQLQAQ